MQIIFIVLKTKLDNAYLTNYKLFLIKITNELSILSLYKKI